MKRISELSTIFIVPTDFKQLAIFNAFVVDLFFCDYISLFFIVD